MSQAVQTSETTPLKGPTLAELREAAGLKTRAVARLVGRTQPRISQIESKGTQNIDILTALAQAYGVSREVIEEANNRVRGR